MKKIKLAEVILDFSLYPRSDVDAQHISYMREAEDSGVKLPTIVIDSKSKRVIDGFHRVRMWRHKYDDNHEIDVIEKTYKNEAEMFLDAIRYNASHGRILTRYDRTHCILLSEKFKIAPKNLASALSMTVEKLGKLKIGRIGELRVGKTTQSIPLKRTISHKHGQKLTKRQSEVNDKLGGMNQVFYVNQIIMLIESGLLDINNKQLLERLNVLFQALNKLNIVDMAVAI